MKVDEAFLRRPPRGGADSSVRWACEYLDDALAAIKPDDFENALEHLIDMIPDDQIVPRPKGFGDKLLRLRDKTKRYVLVPGFEDLDATWETLLTKSRCLKPTEPDASYDVPARQLLIESAE